MKQKHITAYFKVAYAFAECSTAIRLKVGAIVVKDDRIISIGYNGMPSGWDNNCENIVWDTGAGGWLSPDEFTNAYPYQKWNEDAGCDVHYGLKSKPEVLHAERNALYKLAASNESGKDASMFITHSPCLECSKSIYGAGIKRVFYNISYRSDAGITFLRKCGVEVTQYSNSILDGDIT